MKARSIKGDSPEGINSALQQTMVEGFKPTLAIVFLTNVADIDAVTSILAKQGITLFGASTSEKFNEEGIDPDGIIVMLLDMNPAHFKIVLQDFESPAAGYAGAGKVGKAGKASFKRPAFIIITADLRIAGNDVIRGILDTAGIEVPVIGGMAGEPNQFSGFIFSNQSKSSSGLLALIIDEDKVDIKGVAVSGWKPVGTEKKITKSDGNWVYTIDDEPAMDVIKKFLGKEMVVNEKSIGIDSYPLQVQRIQGKPMMRPIVSWKEEDQSIMLGAPVDDGAMFRFSLPPDFEVVDTVIESATLMKATELPEADAMIIFSCVGRLSQLGPMLSIELDGLAATWNTPVAGFFSLGEYGKLDDTRPEFHGTTVSWVAIKEK
ncbi:MAG: hypothetical protein EOO13_01520 [Chitinophagaceae bacterium]|nr:MAG: hypothetical protein EOO13_01520 [Chitinophagaceae bacterium]